MIKMTDKLKIVSCPICNFWDDSLYSGEIHIEIQDLCPYYYSVCGNCGFVYQHERYSKEHYEHLPYQSPENYTEHAQNRATYIYDFIKYYHVSGHIDLLDIGCGRGGVLHFLEKKIPNIRSATGYTLDMNEKPFAKKMDIVYKNFENLIINDNTFNLVIMSHILEHFYDPVKAMKNVWKITKPGALVYIEVPNLYWTEVRIPSVFCPEHLSYFTPTSLANIYYQERFVPLKIKASRHWGNIKVLLRRQQSMRYISEGRGEIRKDKIKKEKHVYWKYKWAKLLYPYYRKRLKKVGSND